MTARHKDAMLVVFFVLLGTGSGYYVGLNHGARHERQATTAYVNQGMAKAGFCRWFKESDFDNFCEGWKP
ncbi:hypothetical protein BTE77_06940 [Ensifer adhaerens]|nr:hypothetical protein BTE77_06940 [Ensifer adhaerens]